jgi:phosphatidylglycerol:prolipoprotein diacylglycerol transferase
MPIISFSHLAVGFPVYILLAGRRIHPHFLFETLSYVAGISLYLFLRQRSKDFLSAPLRLVIVSTATTGATLGAKLLFLLEDPRLTLQHGHDPAYLLGGKTIVGALAGGLIVVELMKRYIGIQQSTGDLFAIPLALGIAIGRVGCFLSGLSDNTYGIATLLPWGVDFGDGVKRHPTQLYEVVFLLALIPVLYWVARRTPLNFRFKAGDVFKVFMVGYMGFRFFSDFIKPYPRVLLGLGTIQWVCLLVLLYYANDMRRWVGPIAGTFSAPTTSQRELS